MPEFYFLLSSETEFHYVAWAVLQLSNPLDLILIIAGVTGMQHHAFLGCQFLQTNAMLSRGRETLLLVTLKE